MRSALQMLERKKNNWRERLRSGLPENTFYSVSKGTRGFHNTEMGFAAGSQQSSAASVREPARKLVFVLSNSNAFDSRALEPKMLQSIACMKTDT